MSGGGGGSSYRPPVQAAAPRLQPVPTADIEANWGPEYGPTATPNPYVADNVPSWMNGWFSMPSWGMDPFGQPLTQEQMMYQRPPGLDEAMEAEEEMAPVPAALPPPPNYFGMGFNANGGAGIRTQPQGFNYARLTPAQKAEYKAGAAATPQAQCEASGGKWMDGRCMSG